MKTQRRTSSNIAVSALLIVIIFGLGLVVGRSHRQASAEAPAYIENAEGEVDFGAFWNAWRVLEDKYPFDDAPDAEARLYGAIQGLARAYEDPYTIYLPPEDNELFNEDLSGEFSGVGMEIGLRDDAITVIAPLKGTPAEQAGILPGDIIYEINGESAMNLTTEEAVEIIRGPRGTTVTITVLRSGQFEPIEIDIVRDIISIPTLDTSMPADGVFMIQLYNFIGDVNAQFNAAMQEFIRSNADKLILDLRNNPGGFLQSSISIASWFLPLGELIVKEDLGPDAPKQPEFRSLGTTSRIGRDFDMVVLINQGSASASEIVAGALQEQGRATLVGEQTFGKGSVQEVVPLPDDTALKITVARWLTPNGTSISENGLLPDVEVERTFEDFQNELDPQLDMAIEIITTND